MLVAVVGQEAYTFNILYYTSILILSAHTVFFCVFLGPLELKWLYIAGGVTSVLNHRLQTNWLGAIDRFTMVGWFIVDLIYITMHRTWPKWIALGLGLASVSGFLSAKVAKLFESPDGSVIVLDDLQGIWTPLVPAKMTQWQRIVENEATAIHALAHLLIIGAHACMLAFYYCLDPAKTEC